MAYQFETPEERERRERRERQMSPAMAQGMLSNAQLAEQQALARQDFEPQEAALAAQIRQGQLGMQAPTPKGQMMGDVYRAPSWVAGLDTAAQRLMGGYDIGKARKGQEGLVQSRKQKADAAGLVAQDAAARAAEQQMIENDRALAKEAQGDRGLALEEQGLTASAEQARVTAANTRAGIEQRRGQGAVEMVAIDEEGNPIPSQTRFAVKGPKGLMFGDAPVDESRWQARDNPNLTAASRNALKTTAADKTADYRAGTFSDALLEMDDLLDTKGYDPTSLEAYKDKITNKFDTTRFMSSADGQQYQSTASTLKEAALRTATGTAAPQGENAEYIATLIPAPFDKPETVKFKRRKLRAFKKRLDELGTKHKDMTPDQLVSKAIKETEEEEKVFTDEEIDKMSLKELRENGLA